MLASKKAILFIIVLVTIIHFSQLFASLDLAIYDFNFWLRSSSPVDERIVIVEWDEKSIQMLEETTISDNTLVALLRKLGSNPRMIGLDLYRDVPVFSPRLSDRDNISSYNALQQIFDTAPNLIGIQKTIEPIINPPHSLEKRGLVTASDVPIDRDGFVRRAFIHPQEDEGNPAGIPYFGVALGYQYLEKEGWKASKRDNFALELTKGDRSATINPAKDFIGTFRGKRYGTYFLVDWKKGNPAFKTVSAIDVISDRINLNLFEDRLVLIGNVSASTADRFYTPFNRWQSSNPYTYGVTIPANVASSMIAKALDNRSLISPIPKVISLIAFCLSFLLTIAYITQYDRTQQLPPIIKVCLDSIGWTLTASLALILINLIFFKLGWWMPISTKIAGIWIICLVLCYRYYLKASRENERRLYLFMRDLNHSLDTPLGSMLSSQIDIKNFANCLRGHDRESQLKIATILQRADNIKDNVKRIEKYRSRLAEFIEVGYLNKARVLKLVNVNNLVAQISQEVIEEAATPYSVSLKLDLDPLVTEAKLDPIALAIILENLLNNALYAVQPDPTGKYTRKAEIIVKTRCSKRQIKFSVIDNGAGIDPKFQHEIFKLFVSFSQSQGIGLYLVDMLVNLYNGKIYLESSENGSNFSFTLPYRKNFSRNS